MTSAPTVGESARTDRGPTKVEMRQKSAGWLQPSHVSCSITGKTGWHRACEDFCGIPENPPKCVKLDHKEVRSEPEDVILRVRADGTDLNLVKEYLILGVDKRDAEKQRDLWLSQNPAVKLIKIHRVKREPPSLLGRMGRKHVPRVSIVVEYEELNRAT